MYDAVRGMNKTVCIRSKEASLFLSFFDVKAQACINKLKQEEGMNG